MEVLKKILNIVIDIFIVLVVIISAIIAIVSITARDSGVANLFGYVPFSVQSNSMSPVFETGDLIVGKQVEPDQEYHVGDIITFWTSIKDANDNDVSVLNTHRIVKITDRYNTGTIVYETKGDNNDIQDKDWVIADAIVSVWSKEGADDGIKIEKLGSVLDYLRKPSGFFFAIVLPMIAFFIYELIRFITNFMNYNKEKQKEAALQAAKEMLGDTSSDSSGLSEEQKAQAILDFLEKQKAEKEAESPAEDAPAEAVEEAPAAEDAAEEADDAPAAEEAAQAEAPAAEDSEQADETEQPATAETEAVTEPEQETEVLDASED
ncbi:MAG: signal peptidase I [Clostridia bacterium]|nr:signal peptidase I [Clostridia bacterium]